MKPRFLVPGWCLFLSTHTGFCCTVPGWDLSQGPESQPPGSYKEGLGTPGTTGPLGIGVGQDPRALFSSTRREGQKLEALASGPWSFLYKAF